MNTRHLSPVIAAMSPAAQRTIRRALTLLERQLREPSEAFTSTRAVRDWLRLQLCGLERETFMVLYLDNQHRLLTSEILFTGSLSSTEVHPREVVRSAMKHNAAAVIIAHNHPSGESAPSKADKHVTQRIVRALALVDVRLLDHLIIGGMDIVSFAERSWL